MNDINWTRIIRAIRNEGTVLFVGPNVERDENGIPVFQQFCRKMVEEYKGEVGYDEKDGFLFFIEPEAKNDVNYSLKEFFEKNKFGIEIFSMIAAIPFHLIISLSPDDSIDQVFTDNNVDHFFVSFDSNNAELEKPSKEKPLIYNMFGLARDNRYILSQEDYYNHIMTIAGDAGLPMKLRMALNSASNYIFIGFDFEKWYVRLLLMILNFHVDKEGKTRHAIQSEEPESLYKQLAEKQFNITFVENKELDFVKTFYTKIQEEGLLKPLKSKVTLLSEAILEKQRLLEEYENILILKEDPKIKLDAEKQIESLKTEIDTLQKQLNN